MFTASVLIAFLASAAASARGRESPPGARSEAIAFNLLQLQSCREHKMLAISVDLARYK